MAGKLYYVVREHPDILYEVKPENSRAAEEELIHLSPAAVHIANFAEKPVLVDELPLGSIVRVA